MVLFLRAFDSEKDGAAQESVEYNHDTFVYVDGEKALICQIKGRYNCR